MTALEREALVRAFQLISADGHRPATIVYDSTTDWDDVKECHEYFSTHERLEIAVDESLWLHRECLSFLSDSALTYFMPSFLANGMLFGKDDLIEWLIMHLERNARKEALLGLMPRGRAAIWSFLMVVKEQGWDVSSLESQYKHVSQST